MTSRRPVRRGGRRRGGTAGRPARPVGRPPSVDADAIGRAVVEIGFDRATFAEVARRLDVAETTLYRHVENRRGLMAAGLEIAFGDRTWPAPDGDWRQFLRTYALETWSVWAAHPGSAAAVAGGAFPAGFVRLWADVRAALVVAGFDAADATLAADLVFDLAATDRRGADELAGLPESEQGALVAAVTRGWEADLAGRDPQTRERVQRARDEAEAAFDLEPREWFLLRLDLVLDGIAARVGRTR
ncbi:MAG: TetR family transcriptional regulator [Actinomycetaceae bacterium]